MATSEVATVKITSDGNIPLPRDWRQRLRWDETQTVQLSKENNCLIVRPLSPQEIGEQIVALLKQALGDTTWDDIQALRAQDEDWH